MPNDELFQERAVKIAATGKHYALLVAPGGGFVRIGDDGALGVGDAADDSAMWQALANDVYRHAVSGRELTAASRSGNGEYDLKLDGRPPTRTARHLGRSPLPTALSSYPRRTCPFSRKTAGCASPAWWLPP